MQEPAQEMPNPELLTIHHKKSGFFRTVYADGAWGGANTGGVIFLAFYAEHPAIPTVIKYPLDKNGLIVNKPEVEGDVGHHREMEVNIALTISAAIQVRQTLDNFIKIAEDELKRVKQSIDKASKSTENK